MFSNPEQNILKLGIKEGMRVADFGAGTGAYSRASSPRVGVSGKVYAIEVQKDLLGRLENDLRKWGISNVEGIWGDIEKIGGTKLADRSIDAVIISNVLFQVEDKLGLIDEAKRILKHDGKVLFIDWKDSFSCMGPTLDHMITKEKAISLFENRGFKVEEEISTNIHHYGIIFKYE